MIYWVLLSLLFSMTARAESNSFSVAPATTDPAIKQIRGEHLVWQQMRSKKLLLSLGGTGSAPQDFRQFDELAASLGYAVIALDYPDQVISTVCREHATADCFDLFRAEIVSGTPGSPWVSVDPANCIESRLKKLLNYLVKASPKEWSNFVIDGEPNWSQITVAGHSQGAGNAAYFSKLHPFERAILFAGPQDTSSAGVARWVSRDSATDRRNVRAFLHAKDFFDETKQLTALRVLLQQPNLSPVIVTTEAPGDGTQVVQTNVPEDDPHNSLIHSKAYVKIWNYLLN